MGTKLRRCPFCGGKSILMWNFSGGYYYIRVKCTVCEAQGKSYKSDSSPSDEDWDTQECRRAVGAWNLRAYDRIDPDDIDAAAYIREFGRKEWKASDDQGEFYARNE